MGQARKYNLNLNSVISCGLGSYTANTVQYSLLNQFTVTCDTIPTTSYTYPQLTTSDLQTLSNIEYDKRVIDFLDYSNIESSIQKELLFSGATMNNPDCIKYYCFLNQDFLIYKFLTGIRVINVGYANGIIQYLVSGDSYNSGWQSNATFLNLDQNAIYTVKIRDYISEIDLVVCESSKLISMPLLLASTTVTLQPKIVLLNQISSDSSVNVSYKTGCFKINPNALSSGQKIQINYIANATVIGEGSSCIHITCKPNNCGTFVNNCCITNLDAPQPFNSSITLCYGDIVCYSVTAIGNACGSCANANFNLTSVDGLCTTIPSIDITNCSASATVNIPVADVTVSMDRCTATNPSSSTCRITGMLNFNPAIPAGQCVNITLSAITNAVGGTSASNICFTCKTNANPVDICICGVNNSQPQPQSSIITARYGDVLCYTQLLTAPNNGTSSNSRLCISNLTASMGVNPIKSSTANCDCGSIDRPAYPVVVSVCRTSLVGSQAEGYINIDPPLNGTNQVVNVTINATQSVHGAGDAIIQFKCQPFGSNTSVNIVPSLSTTNPNNLTIVNGTPSAVLSIKYGDVISYTNYISSSDYGSYGGFVASSATSSSDVIPSVSPTKYSDNVTPVPTVAKAVTNVVQSIAQTTAVGSGCIVCDGGSLVTERGFVWNTSTNPTVANNKIINATAGLGSYTNNITGLVASTCYYVRAYAISSVATVYGVNQSFKTLAVPVVGKVTVTNVDSRHKSIQINGLGGSGTYTSIIYSNPTVIVPIGTYSDANSWSASNAGSINNTPLISTIGYTGSVAGSVCIRIRVTDSTFNNSYGTLQLYWNGSSVGIGTETWSAVQPW